MPLKESLGGSTDSPKSVSYLDMFSMNLDLLHPNPHFASKHRGEQQYDTTGNLTSLNNDNKEDLPSLGRMLPGTQTLRLIDWWQHECWRRLADLGARSLVAKTRPANE